MQYYGDMRDETVSHYQILQKIGQGGMGEVYRARDTKLDRIVALKTFRKEAPDDPERLKRLIREARLASSINHPHVAHIYEIVETPETTMIAMEYVEGKSLSEHIQDSLSLPEILQIGAQIADGLQEAHSKGIIHRDIKPSNILITPKGSVKILDFGLARLFPNISEEQRSEYATFSQTEPGRIVGTWPVYES
jgi:serine/threonine protein kinase